MLRGILAKGNLDGVRNSLVQAIVTLGCFQFSISSDGVISGPEAICNLLQPAGVLAPYCAFAGWIACLDLRIYAL